MALVIAAPAVAKAPSSATSAAENPGAETEAARDARLAALLGRMTLAEKIDLIRGVEEPATTNIGEAGYLPGVPRLGIRPIRLADGPPGVLVSEPSVAEVATMGLAATFDPELSRQNGVVIADEARRLGVDVVLQPFINMLRDVKFVRSYNTFGEDPLLTGTMGVAQIEGIQSRGVLAQAKHFVAYDSDSVDIHVAPQPLHELYVAPFRDAVDAGVSSIMCSYNRLNGDWACGNHDALTDILRGELNFKGFVTSDWGAVHGNLQVPAGMDMEMPGTLPDSNPFAGILPAYSDITPAPHRIPRPDFDMFTRVFISGMPEEPPVSAPDWEKTFPVNTGFKNLSEAMAEGKVTMADIDLAASRVLRELDRFGRVAGGPAVTAAPVIGFEQMDAINQQTAEKAAVLLKNEGGVLPLSKDDLANLAMVGPGAAQLVAVGKAGERSLGMPWRQTSPFDAVRQASGGEGVVLAVANDMTGRPVPAALLSNDGKPGMVHTGGTDAEARIAQLDYTVASGKPLKPGGNHVWQGKLKIDTAGSYWLGIQISGARGILFIDGKRLGGSTSYPGALHGDTVQINQDSLLPTNDGLGNIRVLSDLKPGLHDIRVELESDGSGKAEQVRLAWSTPQDRQAELAKAVEAARKAKKAVVFAWSRNAPVFHLPGDQDALIEAVAAANPNTVVVLNTSMPVAMPWVDKVKAVLQMWWTGDRGGEATADLLLGKVSPGGKLPFTWAAKLEDYPATDPAHPERSAAGVNGKTTYSEGIDIGYRWFDRQGIKPLFPFGHGLSYSRFAYSGLATKAAKDGGVDVRFTLRNTGSVEADEVAQVYLGAPTQPIAGADFAVKALAGFQRVTLKAGESRNLSIHLPRHRFEYWSAAKNGWELAPGVRPVMVGTSAGELPLEGKTPAPR
ncbi:glycoside hydrolase family 3 C-terminal domain-containing protein [Novosphingobium sp. HR1a]|nr:glycoside hydrolase family 3 C-terminal domain-containing protein [Novosphingobium sp. HR1a]